MEEENIEKAVLAYLKKKGYHQAELALKEEQTKSALPPVKTDPEIAKQILHHRSDDVPTRYKEGYNKLQLWVHSSLDLYKSELLWILYPIFVHSFMDLVSKGFSQEAKEFFQMFREDHEALHLRDLQKLQGLLSPQHVQEMELARSLRENKVNIKMCQYSFELLLQYLHNTESTLMLGIVNEHVNFQVVPGQLAAGSEKEDVISVGEKSLEAFNQVNQKEIRWGVLEDSLEERLGKELAAEAEKVDGEGKEADGEEVKKRAAEIGKAGGGKKIKKDKAAGAAGKGLRTETTLSTTPRVKSQLVMPSVSEEKERLVLEDLRCRARLASTALPSVSFYTFINTHHSLNCASISLDGSLVVGGFADSSLKVWDMAKIGERLVDNENGNVDGGASEGIEDGKSTHSDHVSVDSPRTRYKLLQGHAGPIYAANFSPDGDYILSASNDCTVRLWSLQMNANLVCYKGHNHPVWDVQFSPVGHYFASSSHDRTARVWSMDRIQPLRIMAGHLSDVDCVQWHVNCNYIATGSIDKTVRLWDVQTGECMRVFTGHRGTITSLAMSPDGRHMASGDEDGSIMMWDLGSGRCVTPLMGHTSSVWTLDFSCEGSLLCSGSADCTVRIWDVNASSKASRTEEKQQGARRLRLLKTLPTKSSPVYSLRFSRRNHLLAAGPFSPSIEMPPRRSLSK